MSLSYLALLYAIAIAVLRLEFERWFWYVLVLGLHEVRRSLNFVDPGAGVEAFVCSIMFLHVKAFVVLDVCILDDVVCDHVPVFAVASFLLNSCYLEGSDQQNLRVVRNSRSMKPLFFVFVFSSKVCTPDNY